MTVLLCTDVKPLKLSRLSQGSFFRRKKRAFKFHFGRWGRKRISFIFIRKFQLTSPYRESLLLGGNLVQGGLD